MLRSILVVSIIGMAFLFTSCAGKLPGSIYSGYSTAQSATAQMAVKKGEACAMSILGAIAIGDASIDAARRNGGIRSIANVDETITNILGIYISLCTVVYGK